MTSSTTADFQASTEDTSEAQLLEWLHAMRAAALAAPIRGWRQRVTDLKLLEQLLRDHLEALVTAMAEDFGHRSRHESLSSDLVLLLGEIRHQRKHLRSWMRRRPVPASVTLWPARAWVEYQPLGVVGVMAPWNYPVNLLLAPLAAALAAGNRVLAKPSEATPRTSAVLQKMVNGAFPEDQVRVVTGGVATSQAFSALPLDHLLFTGSTAVGRHVMRAAADNLTPVTLELGGKSPVYVDRDADLDQVAGSIVRGKWFNAGQTCIAPDYLLVEGGRSEALAEALSRQLRKAYPDFNSNPDYTHVINQQQLDRLRGLLQETEAGGARVMWPLGNEQAGSGDDRQRLAPALVLSPSLQSGLMREEIFGPVLPLLDIENLDSAIDFIRQRPKPLSMYYFGRSRVHRERLLAATSSGSVVINDALLQFAEHHLPFGGVGDSGMGQYHGKAGFRRFSHARGVLQQARWTPVNLLRPPYRGLADRMLRLLSR